MTFGVHRPVADKHPTKRRPRLVRRFRRVNGNSRPARRFREVCIELAKTIDPAGLTEEAMILIRQCAVLTMQAESLQQRVVAGEDIDFDQVARVNNALRHTLGRLVTVARLLPSGSARSRW